MIVRSRHDRARLTWWLLRSVTAAALVVDAYLHAILITRYDPNHSGAVISQGGLFGIEVVLAAVAAGAVLVLPRRIVWMSALLIAASALGAVVLYRYVDPGVLGPLPDMYEPIWYPQKSLAAIAESIAVVTAFLGYLMAPSMSRRRDPSRDSPVDAPDDGMPLDA